ncbi:Ycf51 family protein [Waterburya agarophytonicola K14]|uniref:Ycf51 family protein n=1 Tax=Waterburya agarophytonicola KI4 TaxID=2874699 RepID=A0A964BPB0_9CYAN|nr:Ycf51 family protein [Waterburya agarophytonicola]MCC0176925.1 Ycf51 family protein [Waterburya agarophytonicola KI4]
MDFTSSIFVYAKWLGFATIFCLLVAILSFVVGWSFRFRLVGVTSFMGVLTAGMFALGLSFFPHESISGAARYTLIYDNGANQAVVAVAPDIEKSAIEPTLLQAASDLYSYGRTGTGGNSEFTIKLRTVLHPQTGVSQPLFLGEAKRSLIASGDEDIQVNVFSQNLRKLPNPS